MSSPGPSFSLAQEDPEQSPAGRSKAKKYFPQEQHFSLPALFTEGSGHLHTTRKNDRPKSPCLFQGGAGCTSALVFLPFPTRVLTPLCSFSYFSPTSQFEEGFPGRFHHVLVGMVMHKGFCHIHGIGMVHTRETLDQLILRRKRTNSTEL